MNLTRTEVKYLRSLSRKKARQAEGKFVLEGWRALREALDARAQIEYIAVDSLHAERDELRDFQRRGISIKQVSSRELEQIADTVHSQGVVALVRQRQFSVNDVIQTNASLIVAADALTDPGNLGTVLRTCEWFGASGALLGSGSVELHNEKVVRSSAGAIFHLPIAEEVELVAGVGRARDLGFRVIVAAGDAGTDFTECDFGAKSVLVLGNEGHGVTPAVRDMADLTIRIPKFGRVESLNVGVACGIILARIRAMSKPGAQATG